MTAEATLAIDAPLLSVRDLSVTFADEGGALRAVDGVSFDVAPGGRVAVIGESGCGKSAMALALLRLHSARRARVTGEVLFAGQDVYGMERRELERLRGDRISMIFQDPAAALNPVMTAGAHVEEAIRLHRRVSRAEVRARALEALRLAGVPEPERRAKSYPFELSGGLRQRVMIATAIACDPALLVADEPTSSLDAIAGAQVLGLLGELSSRLGTALLLVAHDLLAVRGLAREVIVLYAGRIVERGPAEQVLDRPAHPYTVALARSVPDPERTAPKVLGLPSRRRLPTISGTLPDMTAPPPGCLFASRCAFVFARCREEEPPMYAAPRGGDPRVGVWVPPGQDPAGAGDETRVRCFLYDEAPGRGAP